MNNKTQISEYEKDHERKCCMTIYPSSEHKRFSEPELSQFISVQYCCYADGDGDKGGDLEMIHADKDRDSRIAGKIEMVIVMSTMADMMVL
jgi:hypothetical protein